MFYYFKAIPGENQERIQKKTGSFYLQSVDYQS